MDKMVRSQLAGSFDFSSDDRLLGFRVAFFNASITFIASVLFCFSLYRLSTGQLAIASIDFSYTLIIIWSILRLRQDKLRYQRIAQFVMTLSFVALVASTIAAEKDYILSWYILFVIMAFIMGGWSAGISSYVATTITLLLFTVYMHDNFRHEIVITLIAINSIITFIIFKYDRRIHAVHSRLEDINALVIRREHETLQILGKLAEYKDPDTAAHITRVSEYSRLLAEAIGMDPETVDLLYYSAPLHDIGKVGIPDSIMLKTSALNDDEYETVQSHTTIGKQILMRTNSKYLYTGRIIAETHHERWDGMGYPNGLKGESIPIFGRIVAIADVFDALTSERPYKQPWGFLDAMDYIVAEAGKQFDPDLVNIFETHSDRVYRIFCMYTDAQIDPQNSIG